jgi:hypothetical protein
MVVGIMVEKKKKKKKKARYFEKWNNETPTATSLPFFEMPHEQQKELIN